jgi:hypothetical protein
MAAFFNRKPMAEQDMQSLMKSNPNPPPNLGIKTDKLVKSQKWDGKVKSAKCKACES